MASLSELGAAPSDPKGTGLITPGFKVGFALVVSLFFLWAIANNLNDVLIRQFQKALGLDRAQVGLIQFVFYISYFVVALPAGALIRRFGYRVGILAGLALYATGALLFWPAADSREYLAFLAALFVLAAGAACLETAANPYVVAFGDPARAPQRLNLAQAFNGVGGVLAPIVGGLFIFSGVQMDPEQTARLSTDALDAYRASEASMVQAPYLVLAVIVICVALAVSRVRLPDVRPQKTSEVQKGAWGRLFRNPILVGAVAAQFFYVGAQVCLWSFFIDFTITAAPQIGEKTAAFLLSGSLFLFMVGRFGGAALMSRLAPTTMLAACGAVCIALCLAGMLLSGVAAVGALFLTGLFMSIMFPTIFALGVRDLGADQPLGSSLMIMSIVGGALLPPLMGWVSHGHGGLRLALLVPLCAFAVVVAFGFYCRRAERTGQTLTGGNT